MKKMSKLGLIGSLAYTALTFGPSITAIAIPQESVYDSSNKSETVTEITAQTPEQIKIQYELELYEATKDKEIISPEVEKLGNLLTLYLESKEQKNIPNKTEDKKNIILSHDPETISRIDSIIYEFHEKIITYYPRVFSEHTALKYDAFQTLPADQQEEFKRLISQAYQLTKDKTLESLIAQEMYTIKDIVLFDDILEKYKTKQIPAENQGKPVVNKEKMPVKDMSHIKKVNLPDEKLKFVKETYDEYLAARDKEFEHARRYWSPGAAGTWGGEKHIGLSNGYFTQSLERGLEEAFGMQGYWNVDIEGFHEDVKFEGKFPQIPNWAMFTFGLAFPFFRNGMIAKFVKRDLDELDVAECFFGALFFGALFDMGHPWIYPIRVFGTPFVLEPLRKLTRGY